MSLLGNIIWLVFGGFVSALGYILGGLSMCLTIVGIPFGLQSIRLGLATLAPFGKEVVETRMGPEWLVLLFDVLWIVLFGWGIAIAHLVSALVLTLTIIGIPFAKQHIKLIPVAILPFSRDLR